jgi:hypothetical protein
LTRKDLTTLQKYSHLTQTFKIKSTDKNKILQAFFGNEKIQKQNTSGVLTRYIYQLLSLGFNARRNGLKQGDQKTIDIVFASA